MKNLYEGMLILPKALAEDALEQALGRIREEIEKLGGSVKNITRLGRRAFARPLKQKDSGNYVVINFELDGAGVAPLQARLKLNADVFRVQIVRAVAPDKAAAGSAGREAVS